VKEEEFGGESVGGDLGFAEKWMPCFKAVRTSRDLVCGESIGVF